MLGFSPKSSEEVAKGDEALVKVNEELKKYEALHNLMDSWLIIQVGDANWVYNWRLEAEQSMRSQGRDALSDEQVKDFVSRFMPAYEAYLPQLYSQGPQGATSSTPTLWVSVDPSRNLVDSFFA